MPREHRLDLGHRGVGAVDRGAVGQADLDEEGALVLGGQEAGRDAAEEPAGGAEGDGEQERGRGRRGGR